MQHITISGYLAKDAEMREVRNGNVTTLTVPVKQGWGEREQTNWFRVNVWGKSAEYASGFMKGDFVCITGELVIGEYNGRPQYEVNSSGFGRHANRPREESTPRQKQESSIADDLDDEVPF